MPDSVSAVTWEHMLLLVERGEARSVLGTNASPVWHLDRWWAIPRDAPDRVYRPVVAADHIAALEEAARLLAWPPATERSSAQ